MNNRLFLDFKNIKWRDSNIKINNSTQGMSVHKGLWLETIVATFLQIRDQQDKFISKISEGIDPILAIEMNKLENVLI